MSGDSFNPMRYNCQKSGCYNTKHRLNFESFYDCFDGKISMSDVDAAVEVAGNFLFLEWKSHSGNVPTGQRIFFERMTKMDMRFQALIIHGDAETMEVFNVAFVSLGEVMPFEPCNSTSLHTIIQSWNEWAKKNPFGKPIFRNPGTIGITQ